MDKWVTIKFYRVEIGKGTKDVPFSAHLRLIKHTPEAEREIDVDGIPFWVDKIEENEGAITGRFCRKQSDNLPPKADNGINLTRLGVGSIGQTAVWLYHPETCVLAFEATRGGVGPTQFFRYIRQLCSCRGYVQRPVVGVDDLKHLSDGRIRGFDIKIAAPQDLQYVEPEHASVASGLKTLMQTDVGTQIEVRFSLGVGEGDIPLGKLQSLIKWLRGEKTENRGAIQKVSADVLDNEGQRQGIDLLEAHMQEREELDLPNDDPDLGYTHRSEFVVRSFKGRLSELETLFLSE